MKKTKKTAKAAGRIVQKGEKPVVRVENAGGRSGVVVCCDHASNAVPKALCDLGLSKANLKKHIAWDPGTQEIGLMVAKALKAPAVVAGYSRLVVDLNRGENSPECIRAVYDHIKVPGNKGLTPAQRKQRIAEFFTPYHDAISAEMAKVLARKKVPVLVSIHSFTPRMDGFKRPWHIGILWNRDDRIAKQLVKNLRRNNKNIVVGENEPYSLKAANLGKNTVSTHAESRRLPYVIVEFRQDLVSTRAGARKWARIFLESLKPVLDKPSSFTRRRK